MATPSQGRQPLRRDDTPSGAGGRAKLEKTFGEFPAPRGQKAPETINLDTVALLRSSYTFSFRHLRYTVRALPWFDGIQLEYIRDEIARMMPQPSTREHMEHMEQLFARAFAIMWRRARPRGWWWRGRWRNEFEQAGYAEFLQLASFFSECQMLLPALALDITPGSLRWMKPPSPSTSPTGSLSLFRRSRRGAIATGNRAAIGTIVLGFAGSKSSTAATSSP